MGEPRAERARLTVGRVPGEQGAGELSAGELSAGELGWSALHHDIDPGSVVFVRRWLRLVHALARPLVVLRVPPTAVTVAGVLCAAGALLVVPHAAWAAAGLVLAAGVCDALDGAVAVLTDSVSRGGAVADAIADRVVDVVFALVIWRAGAPLWAAVTAAALAVGVDLMRRAVRCPAVITVAERPSWTICATLACLASALSSQRWPVESCLAVWVMLALVGHAQLAIAASRPRDDVVGKGSGGSGGRAR